MSSKERRRLAVLEQVAAGTLSVAAAGRRLGLSERQVRRVWGRYRREGDAGLVHRLRGRPSNRRVDPAVRQRAVSLYAEHYSDLGATLAAEYLAKRHDLVVDDQTLRRWLAAAGLWRRRRRSKPKRHRRPRKRCFGELVQLDGSPHDWFEGRRDPCCLMVMIDDATGWTEAALFEAETTAAAMRIVRQWCDRHGLPQTLYPDRHSIYRRNDKSADEVAARTGKRPPTQLGRALAELGVELIWAGSPQAKGRVERMNGTLQDRLVKALRLAEGGPISDLDAANRFLREQFLPALNRQFAVPPADATNLHAPVTEEQLDTALVMREQRTVGQDQCVMHDGDVLQLQPGRAMPSLAGKRVTVQRDQTGQRVVLWRQQPVPHQVLDARPPRSQNKPTLAQRVATRQPPYKPPPTHPWRAPAKPRPPGEAASAAARAAPSPPLRRPHPAA